MLQYEGPEGTWGFKKKDRSKSLNCAIRSNDLVIRFIELDNLFSWIAICSLNYPFHFLDLNNQLSKLVQFEGTNCNPRERVVEGMNCNSRERIV